MHIAVLGERAAGESRVALVPDSVARLVRRGHTVSVERDAGLAAGFPDTAYATAGARLGESPAETLAGAHLLACVRPLAADAVRQLAAGTLVVGVLFPLRNVDAVRALSSGRIGAFAMERVPRITRAQSMDVLSSQSTVAGYRAALLGAQYTDRFFPMLMTAAGTVPPARVVVCGAGVAGLQAIATCRRLGAAVAAYDIRAEAREQAKSLGAEAIEVDVGEAGEGAGGYARQLSPEAMKRLERALAETIARADVVITTALIPDRPAPLLVDEATVRAMRPGSVIVDMAAEAGGNCALTVAGQVVVRHGVRIVGLLDLPASLPLDASRMYSKNIEEVVRHLTPPKAKEGEAPVSADPVLLDLADEITAAALVVHAGEVRHADIRERLGA